MGILCMPLGSRKKTQQRNNTSINLKNIVYEKTNCNFQHDVHRHG